MVTTFSPNCTFPDRSVNYVESPPLRSTLDIVWPCVLTLIASIYTALHLDVIADTAATSPCKCKWCGKRWLYNRICRDIRGLAVGLGVATIALLAPELIVTRALLEMYWCKKALQRLEKLAKLEPNILLQWTKTHCYYLNMGGLRLVGCRGRFASHGTSPGAPCDCNEMALDRDSLALAIQYGLLPKEPPVTKQEILDLSKTGAFAKILAIWQLTWFMVDLVTRLARHLPISQLEVGVAGFAMLAFATWFFYFSKPKGVNVGTRVRFRIPQSEFDPPQHQFEEVSFARTLSAVRPSSDNEVHDLLTRRLKDAEVDFIARSRSLWAEIVHHISWGGDSSGEQLFISLILGAVIALPFGAIHVAAWNAAFPTVAGQWLWRVSSLVSMLVLLVSLIIATSGGNVYRQWLDDYAYWTVDCCLVLYTAARVILMVEMVRCMLFLSPEAYVRSWAGDVPHLG
ncbi:hypothetical protein GGR53DRAFT_482088 [Hypoxylon sp. FL1150]|nr:hypothetical protein GGR53DRAFT_482088 [Hypoxylon sp. FL1150]